MSDLVNRLARRADELEAMVYQPDADTSKAWAVQAHCCMGKARLDHLAAIAEITRLQKEFETAREDALEEAIAEASVFADRKYSFDTHVTAVHIITAIRALKDKEVAG